METIVPIAELKTHCYQILENAAENDNTILVTKRGKPIAAIIPIKNTMPKKSLFGLMKGVAKINDDLIDSIEVEWDAEDAPSSENG